MNLLFNFMHFFLSVSVINDIKQLMHVIQITTKGKWYLLLQCCLGDCRPAWLQLAWGMLLYGASPSSRRSSTRFCIWRLLVRLWSFRIYDSIHQTILNQLTGRLSSASNCVVASWRASSVSACCWMKRAYSSSSYQKTEYGSIIMCHTKRMRNNMISKY